MVQKNKVLVQVLIDFGAALIGLAMGALCIQLFRNGLSFPLHSADGLILISSIFIALLLRSVFDKLIGRILQS